MSDKIFVRVKDITLGIANTLKQAPELLRIMANSDIRENIPEVPAIQIYFENKDTVAPNGSDRLSFGNRANQPIRMTRMTIFMDLYVRQRSNIGQEMAEMEDLIDVIDIIMEKQSEPYFGVPGIKAFSYRAERSTFVYNKIDYVGVRWTLTLALF